MKFLILFLCISSFQLSANVYSQIAKVSLEVKNASVIRERIGLYFSV